MCFATCKQSPTCLLKTRRLADNHRGCFAPRRWRCSLVQPPERVITDSALTLSTWALPKLHCYPPYTTCVISLANGTGKYDVRDNKKQRTWRVTWALAFFKDARERCVGTFVLSPQCGGGRDDIGSGVSTEDDISLQDL